MTNQRSIRLTILRHPSGVLLGIGVVFLVVLILCGLDIGPLDTDVIITRAWYREAGFAGFIARFFAINQRHPLASFVVAYAYRLLGESDFVYNLIFQAGRLAQGVFLAMLIMQLTGRWKIALVTGLALMFTPLRVRELYQGVNWFIEPTLTLLLASSVSYAAAVQAKPKSRYLLWLVLSTVLYVVSICIYESGIPWIAVQFVIGWFLRPDMPYMKRLARGMLDLLAMFLCAVTLVIAILFVWTPWSGLAPGVGNNTLSQLVGQALSPLTFPVVTAQLLLDNLAFWPLMLCCLLICGTGGIVLMRLAQRQIDTRAGYRRLGILGAVMVIAAILIGASGQNVGLGYLDRITFGRAAGIAVLWTVGLFSLCDLIKRQRWALPLSVVVLVAPGLASTLIMQSNALAARADIPRMVRALQEVNRVIYLPAYVLIITPPDWPTSKLNDAVDVTRHEVQQRLWEANSGLTIDLIRTRAELPSFATKPDSCAMITGESPGGVCLDRENLRGTRWSQQRTYPYEDVVIVRYDQEQGQMWLIRGFRLSEMADYNVTTAGRTELLTNPARIAVPLEPER